MALNIKSGFAKLVEDVQNYFDDFELNTKVSVGWKEPPKQTNQGKDPWARGNRVIFIPGDASGKGGKLVQPMQPGKRPYGPADRPDEPEGYVRPLRDWHRVLTVSVWAYDPSAPNDELAQVVATETLFEWTLRAVNASIFADAIWGDVTWKPITERGFGAELFAGLTFRHPLFDAPTETAFPVPAVTRGAIKP